MAEDPKTKARQAAAKEIAAIESSLRYGALAEPVDEYSKEWERALSLSDEEAIKQAAEARVARNLEQGLGYGRTPLEKLTVRELLSHPEVLSYPQGLVSINQDLEPGDLDRLASSVAERPGRGHSVEFAMRQIAAKEVEEAADILRRHRGTSDARLHTLEDRAAVAKELESMGYPKGGAIPTPSEFAEQRGQQMRALEKELDELPTLPEDPSLKTEGAFKKFLKKLPFIGTLAGGALLAPDVKAAFDRGGEKEAAKTLAIELARMGDPGFELAYDVAGLFPQAAGEILSAIAPELPPEKRAQFAREDYVGATGATERKQQEEIGPTP